MTPELLAAVNEARAAKKRMALLRTLPNGPSALIVDDLLVSGEASDDVIEFAQNCLQRDQSRKSEIGGQSVFVQVFSPPLRLFIIGAVHISQALVPMARITGFEVTVIDPRAAFATSERFPGTSLSDEWPDEALEACGLDRRSAVVALTHDPKIDDPGLEQALKSEAFYIAALGSRRTHGQRRERLSALGFDQESMDRIHGPAGLDIGAVSPAEIAASVLAQMISVLRNA